MNHVALISTTVERRLTTGLQAYGVHLGKNLFPFSQELPLRESLRRIPEPYASRMFYYQQLDCLKRLSQGRRWKWVDLRPDVIVSAMSPV